MFSHETALYLHDMAEREPIPIALTVEPGYHSGSLKNRDVRIFYVKPEWHGLGVSEAESPGGHDMRAHDRERTVCDVVRRKAAWTPPPTDTRSEGGSSREKDLARLGRYARELGRETDAAEDESASVIKKIGPNAVDGLN